VLLPDGLDLFEVIEVVASVVHRHVTDGLSTAFGVNPVQIPLRRSKTAWLFSSPGPSAPVLRMSCKDRIALLPASVCIDKVCSRWAGRRAPFRSARIFSFS
jgi:hypothetical protein